jgi:hypothetical protein
MPRRQTALRSNYEFGAPATLAPVAYFQVKRGGQLQMHFESDSGSPLVVTVQVAPDNATWATTTAAANLTAINGVAIVGNAAYDANILLRQGQDNYLRIEASGPGRLIVEMGGDENLLDLMPSSFPSGVPTV